MPVIKTVNLTKSYGKNRGIIDVNLRVEEGEIFGFIGPNGAGKSTLIRTLLNFIYPTSGGGEILGKDIATESRPIKELVGYVPSEVKYYGKVYVGDIIKYSSRLKKNSNKKQIDDLVRMLDIDMDKRMAELSLGNKKKIAIVQAFLGNPSLLILDEPTNGLDPLVQNILFNMLLRAKEEGKTVFLSSHNLTEVENLCNRVAIIKEGKIIDTMDLQEKLSSFGRIIDIEGKFPKELIDQLAENILDHDENRYKFIYKGDMDRLIKSIAQYNIKNLTIRKENLEDTFIRYYEGEGL